MSGPDRGQLQSPLLHPVFLGALVVLAVNDHLLKAAFPGLLTGKLSDVAALIVVPPIVVEVAGLGRGGRLSAESRSAIAIVAAVSVAVLLVAVKLDPFANDAYAVALGLVHWVVGCVEGLITGRSIGGPVEAGTVLDAGDLVALPAAWVGWWIVAQTADRAGDRWSLERPSLRGFATVALRVSVLLMAVGVLAATSAPSYREVTAVARDELVFDRPDAQVERRAIVTIVGAHADGSIAIEARRSWPRVEPAPRFALTVDGVPTRSPDGGSWIAVDPAACAERCEFSVGVLVSWPEMPPQGATSVAWEVAVTVRSGPSNGFGNPDIASVEGDGFSSRAHGIGPWTWGLAAAAVFAVAAVAAGLGRPAAGRGIRARTDWVVLASSAILVAALALAPLLLPASNLEPAANGTAAPAQLIGALIAAAVAAGAVRWWQGSGALLAIAGLVAFIVLLPFAARLIDEASATFAARAFAAVAAMTGAAAVVVWGGLRRPGLVGGRLVDSSRVLVAAAGAATSAGLFVAAAVDASASGIAGILAALHLVAVFAWWSGSGRLLGVSSFLIAGATILRAYVGSGGLFGGPWLASETITIVGVSTGAAVTFFAALGSYARYPVARTEAQAPIQSAEQVEPSDATQAGDRPD